MKIEKAKNIYGKICEMLDSFNLKFDRNDEKFMINCAMQGDDLPITINMQVNAEKELIHVLSYIPVEVPEDKRIDMAIAVSVTNSKLVDGNFDFNVKEGSLFFKMSNCYIDSTVGIETLKYLFICSIQTIEDFNDKFQMLAEGKLKIDYFIENGNN